MRRVALVGCALWLILLFITGCGSSQVAPMTVRVDGSGMEPMTVRVDGSSMEPTLHAGEEVSVDTQAYASSSPVRGDVILFHYPIDPTQEFIKRVIGLPGDTLKITPNQIYVNGMVLHEPYISAPVNGSPETVTLQANDYFVMGDNRPNSFDSRSWGPVPRNYIIGKVILPASMALPDLRKWRGSSNIIYRLPYSLQGREQALGGEDQPGTQYCNGWRQARWRVVTG